MKSVWSLSVVALAFLSLAQPSYSQSTETNPQETIDEFTGLARKELSAAIINDALSRDKSKATIICYDGTNPSSSGLGETLEEAQQDAKVRRTINACLRIQYYMSTNDCRKTMGLNLPPNVHPNQTIVALLENDANVYPQMKNNGILETCLGQKTSKNQVVDPIKQAYMQLYIGYMAGSPELPKCGPIGKSYKWIKNVYGEPQLFRGDKGYKWAGMYDNGVNSICGK